MSLTYTFDDLDFFDNDSEHNITTYTPHQDVIPCNVTLPEPAAAVTLCAINIVTFLLAVPGNLLVVWVIGTARQRLTPSDVFLFHLTVADGLLALTAPFRAVEVMRGWLFGDFMCKLISLIADSSFYTSIIFLACISVDRYLVIVRARETLGSRSRMCSWMLCAAVWAFGSLLALPALFSVSKLNDSGRMTCSEKFEKGNATSWRLATRGFHHVFGFFLPLGVMIVCYSITITRLLHTRGFKKHRAMKVIILVVAAFLLCWTPYHITTVIDTLTRGRAIMFDCAMTRSVDTALRVTISLALLHSCINPILYAFVGEKFRRNMLQLFQRKLRQDRLSLSRFSRSNSQTSEGSGAVF